MDPNTWYFALSALAQVLAAVLGLTAIFVAVKLEHITKQIDYYKRRGASILKWESKKEADDHISFDAHYILRKLHAFSHKHREDEALIPHLEKTLKRYDPTLRVTPERAIRFMDDTIYSLQDNIKQKRDVIRSIILPSIVTMIAIFASLILLGLTDYFLANFSADVEILMVVTLMGIVGIYLIAVSSYRILWSIE
ncbi:MAG: hypothetical protein Q8R40_06820 [bacterium]|nr:hypothetical protein [bacterium]